ncbi:uncharacterized protein G2W53_004499 [Senna tora]|uniref:Uncharacterized protein n=1 Tax=Senna tora TaxID=362788 RepID=A0A835CGI4_9FABA|nr:uncharacterized protein G2W53_004499 [Senna tora]
MKKFLMPILLSSRKHVLHQTLLLTCERSIPLRVRHNTISLGHEIVWLKHLIVVLNLIIDERKFTGIPLHRKFYGYQSVIFLLWGRE